MSDRLMVPVEVYAIAECEGDRGLVIWHEKEGERKFAMHFSPASLSLYFTQLSLGTDIAHGKLHDVYLKHTGMHLIKVEFPRTEDLRFVAIAHFKKADGNVVTEELKCSDAVSLGLYTNVPFLMEDSVLSHATLMSSNTIRTFEENQAFNDSNARMSALDVPDDDLTRH